MGGEHFEAGREIGANGDVVPQQLALGLSATSFATVAVG
jgi:hypothetical protein